MYGNDKVFDISVLIVEDEEMNRKLLHKILKRFIKRVDVAFDGEEGLRKFQENRYDILISDIKMPNMNGLEMISKIKFLGFEPFVILITAFNDKDYLYEAIKLRINNFMAKPLDMDELERIIIDYCNVIKIKDIYEENNFALQQYINLLEKSSILLKFDINGKIIYVNDNYLNVSGFEKNYFLENQELFFANSEMKELFFKKLNLFEEFSLDIKSMDSNNNEYIIKSFISPIFNSDGEIKKFILIGNV